jgi:hypothetical protein
MMHDRENFLERPQADSEQEEMTNLVQHSTCVLDISDDEGKSKMDGGGKENIPPVELDVPGMKL